MICREGENGDPYALNEVPTRMRMLHSQIASQLDGPFVCAQRLNLTHLHPFLKLAPEDLGMRKNLHFNCL
jgi:hypothetical protein